MPRDHFIKSPQSQSRVRVRATIPLVPTGHLNHQPTISIVDPRPTTFPCSNGTSQPPAHDFNRGSTSHHHSPVPTGHLNHQPTISIVGSRPTTIPLVPTGHLNHQPTISIVGPHPHTPIPASQRDASDVT